MSRTVRKKGLEWKKMDLHVHSSASYDYVPEDGETPADIVSSALAAGLDAIAITDHHTGEGIDAIQKAAEGTRLTVYPGVELTCASGKMGVHLLAIFDPSKGGRIIDNLLGAIECDNTSGSMKKVVVNKSVVDVAKAVTNLGGISILPHVWSGKGIFHEHYDQESGDKVDNKNVGGAVLDNIIKSKDILGLQATDFDKPEGQRLYDYIHGPNNEYGRALAVFQASDNRVVKGHGHAGIGARYSYFKVDGASINSLKQALSDPQTRILQEDTYSDVVQGFPRIHSLTVTGGFFDGLHIDFHENLNTLIGAKGTGKSLLIELLRFGLNDSSVIEDIRVDNSKKIQSKLGIGSSVEISFESEDGVIEMIKRTLSVDDEDDGYDNPETAYSAQNFRVLFLSQNEIFKISESPENRMDFIDRFFDVGALRNDISICVKTLEGIDSEITEQLHKMKRKRDLSSDLSRVNKDLEPLEKLQTSDEAKKYAAYQVELNKRKKTLAKFENMLQTVRNWQRDIEHFIPEDFNPETENDSDLEELNGSVVTQVEALVTQANNKYQTASQRHGEWEKSNEKVVADYNASLKQAGGDVQKLASTKEQLSKRKASLEEQLSKLDSVEKIIIDRAKKRQELLDELEEKHESYLWFQKDKCERFTNSSNGRLQVTVNQRDDNEVYTQKVSQLFKGSHARAEDIDQICQNITPRDFAKYLLQCALSEENNERIQAIADATSLEPIKVAKIIQNILDKEDYIEILSLPYNAAPKNVPDIKLNLSGSDSEDDDNWVDFEELSTGQKSTALLIIALSSGKHPVVIDQPEDSLDIKSIWEDVCQKVRPEKKSRQFIFTTHNSSLAVASDTDAYIVLDADSSTGTVTQMGSMDKDHINEQVVAYLEGGKQSYKRKYNKYQADKFIDE